MQYDPDRPAMAQQKPREDLANYLASALRAIAPDLPEFETERVFALKTFGREWRFDIAFPEYRVAVEVDGGRFVKGRHNDPVKFADESAKRTAAGMLHWKVLQIPGDKVKAQMATIIDMIRCALGQHVEPKDMEKIRLALADWSRLKGGGHGTARTGTE